MMINHDSPSVMGAIPDHECTEIYYPRWKTIQDTLWHAGLFNPTDRPWRLSPSPFPLSRQDVAFFESLGPPLLAFYQTLNRLYWESVRGLQPDWVHRFLDKGKPSDLITFARMKRFRDWIPDIIRPDVIPTEEGMKITELDSVPGGIGITACLSTAYATLGDSLIGGGEGMIEGFSGMLKSRLGPQQGAIAILVSDEAEGYRAEMNWVAAQLHRYGLEAYCLHPRDIRFTEEGLLAVTAGAERPISLIYRFYELFDLKNIPKSELVMYAVKKGRVLATPPYKPWMEEKLAFALLHHPILEPFWSKVLGQDTLELLLNLMPRTWILDPAPLPPSATIPHLRPGGRAVADWKTLEMATQKERQYVIKPSGFSELAWGSRGVSVGHDLSQSEWAAAITHALSSFSTTPYVLQEFHKGRQFDIVYFDDTTHTCQIMEGRVRLSPYYFVDQGQVTLGGILATVCPKDKKIIHGMRDAIMAPCTLQPPD